MDHPISKGYLCRKARGFIADIQYHKDRLLYPKKRVGERGVYTNCRACGQRWKTAKP